MLKQLIQDVSKDSENVTGRLIFSIAPNPTKACQIRTKSHQNKSLTIYSSQFSKFSNKRVDIPSEPKRRIKIPFSMIVAEPDGSIYLQQQSTTISSLSSGVARSPARRATGRSPGSGRLPEGSLQRMLQRNRPSCRLAPLRC